MDKVKQEYPWIQTPLVVGAPMRLIALADLAVEISRAGGIGFIGAGTDVSDLEAQFQRSQELVSCVSPALATANDTLPIGIGVINWGVSCSSCMPLIRRYRPAAVWFFAATSTSDLQEWALESRKASPGTKVWVQVGSVKEAREALSVRPDVLVVQGTDAGGHGLAQGAGVVALFPEVDDVVREVAAKEGFEAPVLIAAGGIVEGRGVAAALALGASGVVMGTRFLASNEAVIANGYRDEIIRASDGGQTTVRSKVYDNLRGTTGWAETHNARGVINKSYTDHLDGLHESENKRLYEEEMKKGDAGWGVQARMTTYAGSAIGLVKEVKGAAEIVEEVREGAKKVLSRFTQSAAAAKL